MLNEVITIGRVVADSELKITERGEKYINFTLAVNRDNSDNTDFIDCVCYKNIAENFYKYVSKGNQIAIKGTLRTNISNEKKFTTVKVNFVQFLEKRKNTDLNDINDLSDDIEIPEGE